MGNTNAGLNEKRLFDLLPPDLEHRAKILEGSKFY